jgi:hypothetical protein
MKLNGINVGDPVDFFPNLDRPNTEPHLNKLHANFILEITFPKILVCFKKAEQFKVIFIKTMIGIRIRPHA